MIELDFSLMKELFKKEILPLLQFCEMVVNDKAI